MDEDEPYRELTPFEKDLVLYLKLIDEEDMVSASEHLRIMTDRYENVYSPAENRYEFSLQHEPGERDPVQEQGEETEYGEVFDGTYEETVTRYIEDEGPYVQPPPLEQLAEARNRQTDLAAWNVLTNTIKQHYLHRELEDYEVYRDEDDFWTDTEKLEKAESQGDAIPLTQLMEAYTEFRDSGDVEGAEEQLQIAKSEHGVGFVDSDNDIMLYYDIDNEQGYIFDMYEVELRKVDKRPAELMAERNYHRDHGEEFFELSIIDRLIAEDDDEETDGS